MLAVDGEVANGTAPDFLIELENGERMYVEATLATGVTPEVIGSEKRMAEVIDAIDDVQSGDFFWDVQYRGVPSAPVRRAALQARIKKWAIDLSYDTIAHITVRDQLPSLVHEEHGLALRIRPRPRQRTRGRSGKSLGVVMPEAYYGNSREPVRVRAREKASKYGQLEHPLVVVVNTFAGAVGSAELTEVLFGDIAASVNIETDEVQETRAPNGIFFNGSKWLNPRLDALVVVGDLTPWTLGQRTCVGMCHPHKHPNGLKLPIRCSALKLEGETVEVAPGISIGEALCLRRLWPEIGDCAGAESQGRAGSFGTDRSASAT